MIGVLATTDLIIDPKNVLVTMDLTIDHKNEMDTLTIKHRTLDDRPMNAVLDIKEIIIILSTNPGMMDVHSNDVNTNNIIKVVIRNCHKTTLIHITMLMYILMILILVMTISVAIIYFLNIAVNAITVMNLVTQAEIVYISINL